MARASDIRIKSVEVSTEKFDYRSPIKFGGRVVNDVVVLNVTVDVETRDGRVGQGSGSMPVGNVWGWPSSQLSGNQTLAAMLELGEEVAMSGGQRDILDHPLEITTQFAAEYDALAAPTQQRQGLPEPMPRLAQLVAASPWEAAVFDGQGKALRQNSYDLLGSDFLGSDLSRWLGNEFSGEYLDQYTTRQPKPRMPLYHLVGALDPLSEPDVSSPIGDGLPETLAEWIVRDGLTHMKIKLNGDDLHWDVQRVVAIDRIASQVQTGRGCESWCYSLDFNEKCENVEYVLEFLARLRAETPAGFERVQYIEQPTSRYLEDRPDNRMHAAAEIKPVVIDESLIDLDSLHLSRRLGYSGIALKACKGQSEALLMGAVAQKLGMFLCVQDLTCIGASFLHSASLASRIPTVAAIEGNGRQYCPAGNAAWTGRYPTMFEITDGSVGTMALDRPGLGY